MALGSTDFSRGNSSGNCDGSVCPSYLAPFEVVFPSSGTSCPCQLPPSLQKTSPTTRIRVEYSVCVSLHRHIRGRIKRTKSVRCELPLRSEPVIKFYTASSMGCLPAAMLCPGRNEPPHQANITCFSNFDWLPPYTPSFKVEFGLPSPPVLTTGCATPAQLVLHTPPELLQRTSIYLCSIVMHLRSSVSAFTHNMVATVTDNACCWSTNGHVPIDKKRFELDCGLWGSCIVTNTLPTCSSCSLDLTHTLEVVVGLSKGGDDDVVRYVRTSLDVLVMDPPPNYTREVLLQGGLPAPTSHEQCVR